MTSLLETTQPTEPVTTGEASVTNERTAYLQQVLGTDYVFAVESGLLDFFHFDQETGSDGLLHVLKGESIIGEEGAKISEGFHHEPSSYQNDTYVDRTHLEAANSKTRRDYRENRYEPYMSKTVIEGQEKVSKSNMFPKEYDALTVLQTIRQAYQQRDESADRLNDNGLLVNEGKAIMLDGTTPFYIRLVMDPETKKVRSAYPARISKNAIGLGRRALDGGEGTKNTEKIHHYLGLK